MGPRVKWSALLLFAVLALTAGFYRWPISSALVAQETGVRLSQSLGDLSCVGRGARSSTSFPSQRFIWSMWRCAVATMRRFLTAPAASARLALLPLLSGRFELAAATLLQPTILLDLDSRPFESGSAISTTIGAKTADRDSTPLGALEIHGGLLRIVSAADNFDTLVEDVEGALDWPRLEDPLNVDLRARWRDEPLAIEARLGEPAALLKGMHSDGQLSVSSSLARIRLRGDFQSGGQNWFAGAVSADVASVAEIKRILGLPTPPRYRTPASRLPPRRRRAGGCSP